MSPDVVYVPALATAPERLVPAAEQLTRPALVKLPASVNFMTIRPEHVSPPDPPELAVLALRISPASADQDPTMLLLADGVVVAESEEVELPVGEALAPSLDVLPQAASVPVSESATAEVNRTVLDMEAADNRDRMSGS